jgi:hypothetical protein
MIQFLPFSGLHQFLDLALHQIALQSAQMADVELAIQVIGFMQQSPGQQLFPSFVKNLAVNILGAHGDFVGAGYVLAKVRNTQAPFALRVLALFVNDFRINQHELGVRVFFEGDIDDRDAASDADLRRGQSNPVSGVHGLEHVIDEFLQFLIECCDRFGGFLKDWIAVLYDGINHAMESFDNPLRSIILQLLAVTLEVAQSFRHGVAAKFFECAARQCQRHHGFGCDPGRGHDANVGSLVGRLYRLAG